MTISSVPKITPSMQARAAVLLAEQSAWLRGRSLVTGESFWIVPGRTGAHYTTSSGCTCKSFQHRGACSHVVAVQLHEQAVQVPVEPRPKPKASYSDLFPACGCGDLADGPDGMCSHCASELEWQQRRNRQRQLVADQ